MLDLLAYLADLFVSAYRADDRPEARQITVACGLVVLASIGCLVLIVVLGRAT